MRRCICTAIVGAYLTCGDTAALAQAPSPETPTSGVLPPVTIDPPVVKPKKRKVTAASENGGRTARAGSARRRVSGPAPILSDREPSRGTTAEGGRGAPGHPADAPYSTPGPTSYISQETIDRFRGSSPADIFRGTPGVLSGEARNGAGGIDPNIRGLQGFGRVAVTIDGAENGLTVYQGYQGVSNRTFLDPDLIGGVDIRKGSDVSSRGVAGTVSVRTLNADDVVKPGEKTGLWLKSGFGTNTAIPTPGALGGYLWSQPTVQYPDLRPTATAQGKARPGLFEPTSGSGSAVAAWKEEDFDLLVGYARRKQGNYFSGTQGRGALPYGTGPRPFCYSSGFCFPLTYPLSNTNYYENRGISSYRRGEEVLNTQLDTESYLAKGTVRFGDGHSLQLGYTGFRSEAGDLIASRFSTAQSQAVQQPTTAGTQVDTGTLRYRWKPEDNDLVDLKANLWVTDLRLRNPTVRFNTYGKRPEDFGLRYDYRSGTNSRMSGADVSNTSHVGLGALGALDLTYGASILRESTRPTAFSDDLNGIPSRVGFRDEAAGFGRASYKPLDWLTLSGGLRYSHYESKDLSVTDPTIPLRTNSEPRRQGAGYSPSAGVLIEPWKGVQLYGNYASTLRMPSLLETIGAYTLVPNPDIRPERSRNWEVGTNLIEEGVLTEGDRALVKFGYFHWNVRDYVARSLKTFTVEASWGSYNATGLQIYNIDRAKFEGLELSGRYEIGGFTAELSGNYYLNVKYCPTLATCDNRTLSADYATNQVPPQYTANLTLSQKLLDDRLTIGGRLSYVGPRAAGAGTPVSGQQTLIALVNWKPYVTADIFADYKLTNSISAWASIENLTDTYYVDPLSLVVLPGPGRTFRMGLTGKFGDREAPSFGALARLFGSSDEPRDWTGFHASAIGGYDRADYGGRMSALDGSSAGYPALESPNGKGSGFSFGIGGGYDRQFGGGVVIGLEGDIARPQAGRSQITYAAEGSHGVSGDNLARARQYEAVRKGEIEWLATIRGRMGLALGDRLMIFASGGLAMLEQREERTQYLGYKTFGPGLFNPVNATAPLFMERASATRVGYVFGGGAQYALGDGWSVKGEYLLAHFDTKDFTFPNARAGVMVANGYGYPVTSTQVVGRRLSSTVDVPMVRFGVNYQF